MTLKHNYESGETVLRLNAFETRQFIAVPAIQRNIAQSMQKLVTNKPPHVKALLMLDKKD